LELALEAVTRKAVEMKVRTIYKLGDEQRVRPTDGRQPKITNPSVDTSLNAQIPDEQNGYRQGELGPLIPSRRRAKRHNNVSASCPDKRQGVRRVYARNLEFEEKYSQQENQKMARIQEETQKPIVQQTEKRKSERDDLATLFDNGGKYEVECVYCGYSTVMVSDGKCQADTEERQYVGNGRFCIRKGNASPVLYREVPHLYKEVPYLCRGCGQQLKIRLKNDLN
jgi:hypothetical protein